jgi:HK97 family phage major capsid protein
MSSSLQQLLERLTASRDEAATQRDALLTTAESEGRKDLSVDETRQFRQLNEVIEGLEERIEDVGEEVKRAGHGNPEVDRIRRATSAGGAGPDARSAAQAWANGAAEALRRDLGGPERRAVISGSVDIPTLVVPQVVDIPHPARLIDLFTNRQVAESMAFAYYRQTARTNNAAPVADLATKPTSVLTVQEIQDRCRVIAHLSEPVPYRIFVDQHEIATWLADEMSEGVYDALEHQALAGDGTGENIRGVLATTGTTAVPFTTDVVTTLRSAITAMQNLGETPTGWALNPVDAQGIDLLRWGASGGLLTEGYETGVTPGSDPSSNNIFGVIPRVVSPTVPVGTALLADWTKLKLFVHWQMQVMANAFGDSLFAANAVQLRAEMLVGVGVLRPKSFAVVDLTA